MIKPDYENTPTGKARYWADEFAFARKASAKWRKDGKRVVKRYLDDRKGENDGALAETRLNLFYSNITTLQAMLYGNTPKVEVMRTFQDANDDVARVAALMAQRILNQDIQDPADDFKNVLRNSLEDRLLPGIGCARVRYKFRSEPFKQAEVKDVQGNIVVPAAEGEKVVDEWVETVYTHWDDYLYGPARTAGEVPWKAYRSYLTYEECAEKWGEEVADKLPTAKIGPVRTGKGNQEHEQCVPQVAVWEIWDRRHLQICWYVEDYPEALGSEDDFLKLDDFYPEPPPMIANATTTNYLPRADYMLAKDLYEEIDNLQTRISILTEACKLVGVYDKANEGVKRIFQEGVENQLIPVDNWAMFAEKGGLAGVVSWVPLEDCTNTIAVLTEKQGEKIQQLYEVTGLADILRGASQPYEAASTSKAKVQFASLRVQRLQLEFSEFASNLQALKLEIMQKHFQPETLLRQSNILVTPDAGMAQQALALLKNPDAARWRITVRPESLALADYAQLQQDRMQFIEGLSMFLQSAQGMASLDKAAIPTLLEMLKWGLMGFRGSNEIEGVLDKAITDFTKKANAPPEKSPEDKKAEAEIKKAEMEMAQSQQESAAKLQTEQAQMAQDAEKHRQEMEQQREEFAQKLALENQKFEAQRQHDMAKFALELTQMREKHALEMEKLRATVQAQREKTTLAMEQASHEASVQVRSENEGNGRDSSA